MIPAGTYAGQDSDIVTTSLPVVAYTTSKMDDETAYQLTKTFWEEKEKLNPLAPPVSPRRTSGTQVERKG